MESEGPDSLKHQKSQDDIQDTQSTKSPRSHRSNGSDTRPTTSYKKRSSVSDQTEEQPPPDGATVLGEGSQETNEKESRKSARPTPSRTARPGSAIKSARPRAPPSARGQRSARPPSARPAPPRLKEKTDIAVVEEETIRYYAQ